MKEVVCYDLALRSTFLYIAFLQVVANMRASSADEVAERILSQPSLSGLQVLLGIFQYLLDCK